MSVRFDIPVPLQELEKLLQHTFRDRSLLQLAVTHASLSFEAGKNDGDNEKLEFVGDAVLGLLVAESLFHRFPQLGEGALTRMRALLVSRKHMSEIGARLSLGDYLLLGRGEERSGGRTKPALLANAMEAILAAVYLDGGLEAARTFVEREAIAPRLPDLERAASESMHFGGVAGDYKSALQEFLQAGGQPTQLRYVTAEESGPDHSKRFQVELFHGDNVIATGEGTSKKAAQQNAAEKAWRILSGNA